MFIEKLKINNMKKYNPQEIESCWQKIWEKEGLYKAKDFDKKKNFYILIEFPYPSGAGLHVGHARSWSAMDALSRKKRMDGFNVLYPIGWDAFGLPAENYAIKTGIHPSITTAENIENSKRQIKSWGLSFDWDREINTSDPKYYKWTQWIFLKLLENDMAYQSDVSVNWCPFCKTNLANEEVMPDGTHERCGSMTEKRMQKQWLLKITKYAEKLLDGLKEVDYPDKVRIQQENWIGKSEGTEIKFSLDKKLNFVLLHGFTGSPKANFFPWLKESLEGMGHSVYVPELPNTNNPSEGEQVDYVLKNAKFDENTVLLGHSLGAVVALKVIEKLKVKITGLVLAAGFIEPNFIDHERPFKSKFEWKVNFEDIKNKVGFIKVLRAINDTAVPANQADLLISKLGGELVEEVAEDDHFCGEKEELILKNVIPSIDVFTTRPDTIFGVTALVVAPEHPVVSLIPKSHEKEVLEYIAKAKKKSEIERLAVDKEKTGVFTGLYAINPVNNEKIPVWVGDYVVGWYGKGAVMMVPAHDGRDFKFAQEYHLPVIKVIDNPIFSDLPSRKKLKDTIDLWEGEGKLINSGEFNGQDSKEARKNITKWLEKHKSGSSSVQYKLRDWVFSRQHYWGEPIPVIHCEKCGVVAVPENELPVELPYLEKYQPSGNGKSPLEKVEEWINTKCPKCGGKAKRETDTMPNWAGSNWYFLRYLDPDNDKVFAGEDKMKYWMPVDIYQGGFEHTTLHLLYSRFIYRFLHDIKAVPTKEPYIKRRVHGIVLGPDGRKMSKSLGNVINPDQIVRKFGADTLRIYEAFMGPFDQTIAWSEEGVEGCFRFLKRVYLLANEKIYNDRTSKELLLNLHKTVKKVSLDIESFKFNTAIASMMEFVNSWQQDKNGLNKNDLKSFLLILAPFAPHIAEEIWQTNFSTANNFNSIHKQSWPEFDPELLEEDEVNIIVQVNGRVRDIITTQKSNIKNQISIEEEARKSKKIQAYLQDRAVKKVIYVEGKIINFVI